MLNIVLVLVVVLDGFGVELVLMRTGPAKFALRHSRPLGLTNLSRTTTRTSTGTINDLVDSELQDNS
jgi:hypothetical protein